MKLVRLGIAVSAVAAFVGVLIFPNQANEPLKGTKYIGAEKCKKCHDAKSKGALHTTWSGTKHAKAFEALASDKAKEIAKAKGIADPQKEPKCTKCHTTGAEAPADWDKNFKAENVQCEACHGPGEKHFKARMASEDESEGLIAIPDDEIIRKPDIKTCVKCHNEESPSFQPFCFKMRYEKIMHLDPRKKRTEAELKAMKCTCVGGCTIECKCKSGECGGIGGDKK